MKSRNYFDSGNRIDCYMKMELGIEIKFIFRMEIMRIFSVCGLMTTGRRNRTCKSLEINVCILEAE